MALRRGHRQLPHDGAEHPGTIQNTARWTRSPSSPRATRGNNASTAAIVVTGTVDLTITKNAPANVSGGEPYSYTLTVSNIGTGAYTGTVTVTTCRARRRWPSAASRPPTASPATTRR
ncbi:MAG: hypothetical protein U0531_08575 [Dehalococcoidia bacterium]